MLPCKCKHCGKEHATQEELDAKAMGDEGLPSPEPLPHEILAGEAPETVSEKFVPKRTRKSKK